MSCQNCVTIQKCEKLKHNTCFDFKLRGDEPTKPKKSRDLCSGCRTDWYNSNVSDGCWNYKTSKVVKRSAIYSKSQRPPYGLEYQLSCFGRKW